MRNRQASTHNVLVAHQQNQMIRRAILATGNAREFERMRRVYAMLLNDSRVARDDNVSMNEMITQLDDPEVNQKVGLTYLSEITNYFKKKIEDIQKGPLEVISKVLNAKGLVGSLHTLVDIGTKPETEYEKAIQNRLQQAGNFSATLKVMGQLISARTPEELSNVVRVGTDTMREWWGVDPKAITQGNFAQTKMENLNKRFTSMPDTKYLVVTIGLNILKFSALALLMKTGLAVVGVGVAKVVAFVLVVCLLTNTSATAQIFRKIALGWIAFTPAILKDLANSFRFLWKVTKKIWEGGKSIWEGGKSLFKKLFRRAAVRQIQQMLRDSSRFRRTYALAHV